MKREGGIREETCVHFKKAEFVKKLKSIKHGGQGGGDWIVPQTVIILNPCPDFRVDLDVWID